MTSNVPVSLIQLKTSPSIDILVDVSIEFAHIDVSSYDSTDVARSGQKAAQIAKFLTKESKTFSVSLLIDDKESAHRMTSYDVSLLMHEASNWLPVDYVVFESRLVDYKLDLFDNIRDSHKLSVTKQVDRFEAKSGRLACSHDIAIWHLLRLGKISPDASTVVPVSSRDRFKTMHFAARSVFSILNEADREPEERAMSEILKFCTDETVSSRINIEYV